MRLSSGGFGRAGLREYTLWGSGFRRQALGVSGMAKRKAWRSGVTRISRSGKSQWTGLRSAIGLRMASRARGSVRHSSSEYCRFLAIAPGSTAELETHIELGRRLRCVHDSEARSLANGCQEVDKMLNGLCASMANRT